MENLIDSLAEKLFPHQESEEEQEMFTPEGRMRVAEWLTVHAAADVKVRAIASEFVEYYTGRERHPEGGCGNCGGSDHSSTCFVGRFERALR